MLVRASLGWERMPELDEACARAFSPRGRAKDKSPALPAPVAKEKAPALPPPAALPPVSRVRKISKIGKNIKFCKFLVGSFSAVSKRNFARKYAFDSIFQALQDLHHFAPLQSQNSRKKSAWKNSNFRETSAKMLQMSKNWKFAKFCQISKISAWESGRFWKMVQNAYLYSPVGGSKNASLLFGPPKKSFDWLC